MMRCKENEANKIQKVKKLEQFIIKWQEKTCLWDICSEFYKNGEKRRKLIII